MKCKILLLLVTTSFVTISQAQKKEQKVTGYAITAQQKGQNSWKEVRLVDITTGDEVKSIYKGTQETEVLNARTGKPIAKKDINSTPPVASGKRVVNLDMELADKKPTNSQAYTLDAYNQLTVAGSPTTIETTTKDGTKRIIVMRSVNARVAMDKPFSTNSAAMAYDKKHDRLYYTPMSINQLRYIDLKTNKIYFFEDEPFGNASLGGSSSSQITRMVVASDGNGYALTNDGNHLIRFTTDKKPTITDLGALTDDPSNAKSVHSAGGYGGDMIADASKNLYLITANRNVFKISLESKVAKHEGTIKGLPQGFSTNGAMVEEGSKVIVCSSESTTGYYRFDLTTMLAEKVSTGPSVFNASDLANGVLAFDKKKKDKKEKKEEEPVAETKTVEAPVVDAKEITADLVNSKGNVAVYPNPVTEGQQVKLTFTNQPSGKYQVQLLDMNGKVVTMTEITINSKMQVMDYRLPQLIGRGNYLIKIYSEANNVSNTVKLVVQ